MRMRASKFFREAVQPITFRKVRDGASVPGLSGWDSDTLETVEIDCLLQQTVGGIDPTKSITYGTSASATCFIPSSHEDLIADFQAGDAFVSPSGLEFEIIEVTTVKAGDLGKVIGDFTVVVRGVKS